LMWRALMWRALMWRALMWRALMWRALMWRALMWRALWGCGGAACSRGAGNCATSHDGGSVDTVGNPYGE
ncbi:hypothetical protein OKJ48_34515, partial [Streptomyces kunmingensis]